MGRHSLQLCALHCDSCADSLQTGIVCAFVGLIGLLCPSTADCGAADNDEHEVETGGAGLHRGRHGYSPGVLAHGLLLRFLLPLLRHRLELMCTSIFCIADDRGQREHRVRRLLERPR